jgi:hypothetical protein
MRQFLVYSLVVCAAISLAGRPAVAQTVTLSVSLGNPGPVTSCTPRFDLHFKGQINTEIFPGGKIQYKWTFSDIGDQQTQTINLPRGVNSVPVEFSAWSPASAAGWAQLNVTYPINVSSNKLSWKLICPTVGSFSAPLTLSPSELVPGLHVP